MMHHMYSEVMGELLNNGFVVVSGPAGSGNGTRIAIKTGLGKQLGLSLLRECRG